MSQSCMHFGVCIGDGWYPILYKLSEELSDIVIRKQLDPQEYSFAQIKEKFGLLRIYMSKQDGDMSAAVLRAEEASAKLCEDCGEIGWMHQEGWMRTSCTGCQKKWRRKTNRPDPTNSGEGVEAGEEGSSS